jgi:hypothetical protein
MAVVDQETTARFGRVRTELEIDKIFRSVVKLSGSDLHMKVGKPPYVRVNGSLRPMNREPIDDEEMVRLCFPMMEAARTGPPVQDLLMARVGVGGLRPPEPERGGVGTL